MVSKRMTSAPSWARVSPPSGAATNAEPSTTRSPESNSMPHTIRCRDGRDAGAEWTFVMDMKRKRGRMAGTPERNGPS